MRCSDLPRLMQCRSFPALAETAPKYERPESDSKRESDAARYALQCSFSDAELTGLQCPNGHIIQPDMAHHVETIRDYIRSLNPNAEIRPSAKIDWSLADHTVISGIADVIAWDESTRTMYVHELKWGFKLAEVENNFQLIGYAIGAMMRFGHIPDFVIMTIYQPRAWHPNGTIRSTMITRAQLADARLQIISRLAEAPAVCVPGVECYGCPAAGVCPAANAAAHAAIDVSMNASSDSVDSDRLGAELRMLEHAEEMIKIRKKALTETAEFRIRSGESVRGWALKESISNRQWAEGVTADFIQQMSAVDVSDRAIVSPAQAEKRGVPKAIVDSFTTRKSNGFKLVQSNIENDAAKLFSSKG